MNNLNPVWVKGLGWALICQSDNQANLYIEIMYIDFRYSQCNSQTNNMIYLLLNECFLVIKYLFIQFRKITPLWFLCGLTKIFVVKK